MKWWDKFLHDPGYTGVSMMNLSEWSDVDSVIKIELVNNMYHVVYVIEDLVFVGQIPEQVEKYDVDQESAFVVVLMAVVKQLGLKL